MKTNIELPRPDDGPRPSDAGGCGAPSPEAPATALAEKAAARGAESKSNTFVPLVGEDLRRNNFDVMRLALAVLVILSHSYFLAEGHERNEPLEMVSRGQIEFGSLAVDGFFIISGFLITHSWAKTPNLREFVKKRALRIYPGFIAAMLFCALVVVPLASDTSWAFSSWRRIRNFGFQTVTLQQFMAPGLFESNPAPYKANGSMWTIRYEFWCYLAAAGLGAVSLLLRRRIAIALFLAAYCLHALQGPLRIPLNWGRLELLCGELENWPRFATYFLAGIVFYLHRRVIRSSARFAALSACALIASLRLPGAFNFAMPIFGTYLIFYVAFHPRIRLHGFAKNGDFSYGTYLYAYPIQQLLVRWSDGGLTPVPLFWSATILSLVGGFISWHLVEKHFLRLKPHPTRVPQDASARDESGAQDLRPSTIPCEA